MDAKKANSLATKRDTHPNVHPLGGAQDAKPPEMHPPTHIPRVIENGSEAAACPVCNGIGLVAVHAPQAVFKGPLPPEGLPLLQRVPGRRRP